MRDDSVTHRLNACCPRCKKRFHAGYKHYADYPEQIRQHVKNMMFKMTEQEIVQHLAEAHGDFNMAATCHNQQTYYIYDNNYTTWSNWTATTDATSTCTTTTCTSDAWDYWTSDSGRNSTSNTVWVTWTSSSTGNGYAHIPNPHAWEPTERQRRIYGEFPPQRVETDNERAQRLERERIAAEERRERERRAAEERKRIAAEQKEREDKARQLLREVLTDAQNKELDEKGHFELAVVGGSRYRIKKGNAYNVEKLDQQGKLVEKLCFNLPGCHDYDTMVMQKLLLETDEEQAMKSANRQAVNGGRA